MKPTVIRGVKIQPGSEVWLVSDSTFTAFGKIVPGAIKTQKFVVVATNGETFAVDGEGEASTPSWIPNPMRYCVSARETKAATEAKYAELRETANGAIARAKTDLPKPAFMERIRDIDAFLARRLNSSEDPT